MKKILVVEDDPVNATVLHDYLEAQGYGVTIADTGPAGVAAFDADKPDLAIVDVLLPKTNGFEVCFEIKRTSHGKSTPVFLMSAVYTDVEHARRYTKDALRAQAYFVKPFDLERLLANVRFFLGEVG